MQSRARGDLTAAPGSQYKPHGIVDPDLEEVSTDDRILRESTAVTLPADLEASLKAFLRARTTAFRSS